MTEAKPRDKCVVWTGLIQPNGYGRIHIGNTAIGAHRLAWALANGRAPKRGMDICHSCDNRKCINPKHLFEGTRSDNMQDAERKNRLYNPNKDKKEPYTATRVKKVVEDIEQAGEDAGDGDWL